MAFSCLSRETLTSICTYWIGNGPHPQACRRCDLKAALLLNHRVREIAKDELLEMIWCDPAIKPVGLNELGLQEYPQLQTRIDNLIRRAEERGDDRFGMDMQSFRNIATLQVLLERSVRSYGGTVRVCDVLLALARTLHTFKHWEAAHGAEALKKLAPKDPDQFEELLDRPLGRELVNSMTLAWCKGVYDHFCLEEIVEMLDHISSNRPESLLFHMFRA